MQPVAHVVDGFLSDLLCRLYIFCFNACVDCYSTKLPTVDETVLKKRKQNEASQARHARSSLLNKKVSWHERNILWLWKYVFGIRSYLMLVWYVIFFINPVYFLDTGISPNAEGEFDCAFGVEYFQASSGTVSGKQIHLKIHDGIYDKKLITLHDRLNHI